MTKVSEQFQLLQFLSWIWEVLTLWHPLLQYGYSYKVSSARPGEAVICNFWHPGTLMPRAEHQSARVSKITNDALTRSGNSWTHMATSGVKGLTSHSTNYMSLQRQLFYWAVTMHNITSVWSVLVIRQPKALTAWAALNSLETDSCSSTTHSNISWWSWQHDDRLTTHQ